MPDNDTSALSSYFFLNFPVLHRTEPIQRQGESQGESQNENRLEKESVARRDYRRFRFRKSGVKRCMRIKWLRRLASITDPVGL